MKGESKGKWERKRGILGFTGILWAIIFIGCSNDPPATIEGIWKCTPETAIQFPEGIQETVLFVDRDEDKELTFKACFTFNGEFHHTWDLNSIVYNDSSRLLEITDSDGDIYEGRYNPDDQSIKGCVYAMESNERIFLDSLDLVRTDEKLTTRLFHPRVADEKGGSAYAYATPLSLGDGLNTASISAYIDSDSAFNQLMNRVLKQEFGRLESLLIMKDSALVAEEYFYGYDRNELHDIQSCTKSITSLLLGIVLEQYPEISLENPLSDFFPEYDSLFMGKKEKITLEHLITMTAGFSTEDIPGKEDHPDQIRHLLRMPLASEPGTVFRYNNNNSILLGAVLQRITGIHADVLAEKLLFTPMEISRYRWKYVGQLPQCHSELEMLPRDMAKIGQLVLNQGRWGDRQLVPARWIEESTSSMNPESAFFNYGYQWWIRSVNSPDWWEESKYPVRERYKISMALGHGGQFIMVIQNRDLVVVTTASDYANPDMYMKKVPLVEEEIIPLF